MPKSTMELRMQLSAIEPDEHTYDGIGPSEVDGLEALLNDEEAWLAARAVHALSRIDADSARAAVVGAAQSPRAEVRVAVANSVAKLPTKLSNDVLSRLLEDSEAGVRKFAIKSVTSRNSDQIKQRLASIATSDANPRLRQIAEEKRPA